MNDRFKFRVWHTPDYDESEMIYDAQATYDNACFGTGSFYHCTFQEVLDDKNCVVMQSTGLKDKNGKLIYEGDIVIYTSIYSGNLTGEVYWDSETLQYKLKLLYSSGEVYADRDLAYFVYKNNIEVIGNVYENKELLECQK